MSNLPHPAAEALAVTDELTREAVANLRNIQGLGDAHQPAPELVAAYVQTAGMIYAAGCLADAIENIDLKRITRAVEEASTCLGNIACELAAHDFPM